MKKETLFKRYTDVCNEYLELFCKKHDFTSEGWVGDHVGTIAVVSDYYVSLQDIVTDIERNVPEEQFLKWYDYCLECNYAELNDMNYISWLNGCPRHCEESLKKGVDKWMKKVTQESEEQTLKETEEIMKKNPKFLALYNAINELAKQVL